MKEIRTRFAPSPTGYMHVGNLRTALYEYLIAKHDNGKFILRIEDTDQERFVEGATEVIYKTLKMVGMEHDEGPDVGGEYGPYVQSERKDIYLKYAKQLVEQGDAYYCFCDKEELNIQKEKCQEKGLPYKYNGKCKKLSQEEIEEKLKSGIPYVIRQKIPNGGKTVFHDEVYGDVVVENKELDENVLIKSDGFPTYNFANVIDDHLMNITDIVRGNEYISSTPKYVLLYNAFGWESPRYIHLPPIMGEDGKKLSKRNGDASFQDLYNEGYLTEAIINYITLLGWHPSTEEEFFTLSELKERFTLEGLSKSPAIFDIKKLRWMNGEYIRKHTLEEFHEMAKPYYKNAIKNSNIDLMKISKLLHTRTEVLSEIPDNIDFIDALPDYDIEMYTHKKMKTDNEISLSSLEKAKEVLLNLKDWDFETLHDTIFKLIEKEGLKNGQILWPIRTALTGKQFTPGGAIEFLEIFGKEESIKRIDIGIEKLRGKV